MNVGRRWIIAVSAALAVMASARPLTAQGAAPAPSTPPALARLVDSASAAGFSGLVLVGSTRLSAASPNSILFERAVGVADRATLRPLRVDDVWRWASVTKQVTATLVMQQVDSGRLALTTRLATALPAFRGASARDVTIRDLLQHTSGLPNPDATPSGTDGVPAFYFGRNGGAEAALGYCAGEPVRAPDVKFEYNNCDYLVLGAILERLTGKSFAALVDERIRTRLGASSVHLATSAPRDTHEVRGYIAGRQPEPELDLATFGAAGALRGTARDLLIFDRALAAGSLLSPAARAELWRGDPKLGTEALGVWVFDARLRGCAAPVTLVERRGEIGGIAVRNVIAPALGRAVIVFTNDADVPFGEVWQGAGFSHALLSAALCPASP